jgi:hypothetical protein
MKQSTDITFKMPFQVYHFTFPESPSPNLRAFLMRKLVGFVTVLSRHCNFKTNRPIFTKFSPSNAIQGHDDSARFRTICNDEHIQFMWCGVGKYVVVFKVDSVECKNKSYSQYWCAS